MQIPERCPNCDAEAGGRFCPDCGQRQARRLSIRLLIGEFFARYFSAESGIWRTFGELTVRPGRTARNYIDGKRRRYISPLLWYFFGAAAVLFGLLLMLEPIAASLNNSLPEQYFAMLIDKGIEYPREWTANRYMVLMQNVYTWLGFFTFVLPMAIVLRLVLGAKRTLAETFAVSLFSISHTMMFTAVTGLILTRINPNLQFWVSQGLYDIYALLTVTGCYGWSWRNASAALLSIGIACTCFFWVINISAGIALTSWI